MTDQADEQGRMTTRLSLDTLQDLPEQVGRPTYARADLAPGIVHFGVGNFHRGHMAVYLDRLFEAGRDRDWAIVGAGVTDHDTRMRAALAGQDWLTTVVEQSETAAAARVTGAMIDFLPPGDTAAVVACLADPRIRIVSLTVTEGGYFIDGKTGAFAVDDPLIRADIQDPEHPKTVFGLILAGLRARRAKGVPPFTVVSSDNVPHNGVVAMNAVAGLAAAIEPALAKWVCANVAFPNGMVDRVVPATGERERRRIAGEFGIADAAPVFCEDYLQWVLEDHFPAGRPALETVGVTFVPDVAPFETMKLRILNGGHALIAYPAALMGIELVHEALRHDLVGGFMAKVEREEIIPVVPPVPGVDLHDYLALIERRFANPGIEDTTRRLCFDGASRQPKFIIPSIRDRLEAGQGVTGLALGTALWCRYCAGTTESGSEIAPNDPTWDRLRAQAEAARAEPEAWLAMRDIYGDVADAEAFRNAFATSLAALWQDGTAATLRRYLS
jgi:mannitol 2-dehydrogenase